MDDFRNIGAFGILDTFESEELNILSMKITELEIDYPAKRALIEKVNSCVPLLVSIHGKKQLDQIDDPVINFELMIFPTTHFYRLLTFFETMKYEEAEDYLDGLLLNQLKVYYFEQNMRTKT